MQRSCRSLGARYNPKVAVTARVRVVKVEARECHVELGRYTYRPTEWAMGDAGGQMAEVIDVTDETFETEVLERSMDVPVVVDLWASWCGPCRTLGPVLEKLVAERDGEVVLVKVDVDANPRASATFQVQSIPAVYALRNKRVVSGFIGAQPESSVRAWLTEVAPAPSEVDQLVAAGDEASLRKALALEPANEKVIISLATVLIERGDEEGRQEGLQVLSRVPETAEVRHLLALARVGEEASGGEEVVTAKLDALLERVKADPAAKQEYLDLLELMGPDDPRVPEYRKALTTRLF